MPTIRRTAFCPHCGNFAPQKLLFTHSYYQTVYELTGEELDDLMPAEYFVATCETCHELLLYYADCGTPDEAKFERATLQYPKPPRLHKSVPQTIVKSYLEAVRIRTIAPNAYAVMLRRALEALCDNRSIPKGMLQARLKSLADQGEIPPVLAEMTTVLRVLGNAGAHNDSQKITVPMTWGMDDFFRAIIEYVYIAPSELNEFKKRLERYKADGKKG
jgi:hypothetical protein